MQKVRWQGTWKERQKSFGGGQTPKKKQEEEARETGWWATVGKKKARIEKKTVFRGHPAAATPSSGIPARSHCYFSESFFPSPLLRHREPNAPLIFQKAILASSGRAVHIWLGSPKSVFFPKGSRTWHACVCAKSLQSCPAVCSPIDCTPPGYSVRGILQARILEWVAISSSRGSSCPRDWTWVSSISLPWQAGSLPLVSPGKYVTWQIHLIPMWAPGISGCFHSGSVLPGEIIVSPVPDRVSFPLFYSTMFLVLRPMCSVRNSKVKNKPRAQFATAWSGSFSEPGTKQGVVRSPRAFLLTEWTARVQ